MHLTPAAPDISYHVMGIHVFECDINYLTWYIVRPNPMCIFRPPGKSLSLFGCSRSWKIRHHAWPHCGHVQIKWGDNVNFHIRDETCSFFYLNLDLRSPNRIDISNIGFYLFFGNFENMTSLMTSSVPSTLPNALGCNVSLYIKPSSIQIIDIHYAEV